MHAPMIYETRQPKHVETNKTYPALFLMHGIGHTVSSENQQDFMKWLLEKEEKSI